MARANYYITPITAILSPGRCIFCLPHFTVWQNKIRVGSSLTSLPLRFPTRSLTRLCSNSMNHITCDAADEAANSQKDAGKGEKPEDVVVQYVVLRRDLIETWPLGSVVTQGCHASVSAIWSNKEDPHTLQYCSPENIDSMHKTCVNEKGYS
uniref:peptidyl-tRNA hydrolase n=1 Tax=Manihot esculenta TaxID=3983 RepID=A0A2C9W4S7_MANES